MSRHLTDARLALAGVGVAHHFGGGCYVKETIIPAGQELTQHAHAHDHLSYLVSGTVSLFVDGVERCLLGPDAVVIEAGKAHSIRADSTARWLCIWATDCTDAETVDKAVSP